MRSLRKSLKNNKNESDKITGQYLTLPAALEDGKIPSAFSYFSIIVSAFLFITLLWASLSEIRELAVAQGEIVPSGSIKLVQHLEGGLVEEVFVQEGQIIEANAPLLRLRPEAVSSDYGQYKTRLAHLRLQDLRLKAHLENSALDFAHIGTKNPKLIAEQRKLFMVEKALEAKERQILESRIAQRKSEIKSHQKELESLKRQVLIQQEQLAMRENLLKDGYTSRRAYLETKATLETVTAQRITLAGRLENAREQLKEAQSQLQQASAQAQQKYSVERSKIAGEIAELEQSLTKLKDRFNRLFVRAPVRGIVQELAQNSAGQVVKPGELVARIVPLEGEVEAEVQIEPKDIGHIVVGQKAELKISTYDPNIYGVVVGAVKRISASTFQKENGDPYFKAIIRLEKNYVSDKQRKHLILPGMVLQADIITGAKSLAKYLLKPVYRSLDRAFSER